MARSSLCLLVALAGCSPTIMPAPINVAPVAKVYTCAEEKAAAAEPMGPVTAKMMEDYRIERAAEAAAHETKNACL